MLLEAVAQLRRHEVVARKTRLVVHKDVLYTTRGDLFDEAV